MKVDYEKLDILLLQRGLSRRKLAEKIDVSPGTLAGSFRRHGFLKAPTVVKIAEALHVSPDEFTDVSPDVAVQLYDASLDAASAEIIKGLRQLNPDGIKQVKWFMSLLAGNETYVRRDKE